ncbi:hypothetical protein [Leeuwenhoekiella marinoflava]|uniref:GIY-YIG domain-containing protein n=2 Tax=Leeuwenhoekiella marinoflava TaxID=988 RepID=A0A4Q0PLU0_9FLAO|nr:hypothetical protein [Leeuwenhoekiella marinoflava]RXG30670.1 hypothetical protein DSL99_1712 [Leeuwenhoekiella marinoflava]SHF20159.1 hypothetical protein SAMN02745246_01945 [Leeuwenhoekiella marinoflava DSM 3653]
MNFKEEVYPKNLNLLLDKANDISLNVIKRLNHKKCSTIADLYFELHKTCTVQPEYSVIRNKKAFNELGYLPNIKSGKVKSNNEFKGLYVFGEEMDCKVRPVYVGISRTVYRRLRQHGFGKLHNESTLAYLMAKNENEDLTRASSSNSILEPKREILRNFKVALYPVLNDYELYFYEVALAGILKTKWNTFRTH